MKLNHIYCGDSLKLMVSELDDDSIDLIICDGPYGVVGYDWDKIPRIGYYNQNLLDMFVFKLKPGGVVYLFGKANLLDDVNLTNLRQYRDGMFLQSRIIWYQPSRLSQGRQSYTNNYDVIAYFSKGEKPKTFNLDAIRVPQTVNALHRQRVEDVPSVKDGKFGKTAYNPDGKNPGNCWTDIKQLTYKSHELMAVGLHTIQKPEILIERLVKASSNEGDVVLDPFSGVGTTAVVCQKLKRDFIGFEMNQEYIDLTTARLLQQAKQKTLEF